MRYSTAAAFRDALEHRLNLRATERQIAVNVLRKQVAIDRFLARLAVVAPGRWVVKGAYAIDLRLGSRGRAMLTSSAATTQRPPCMTCATRVRRTWATTSDLASSAHGSAFRGITTVAVDFSWPPTLPVGASTPSRLTWRSANSWWTSPT